MATADLTLEDPRQGRLSQPRPGGTEDTESLPRCSPNPTPPATNLGPRQDTSQVPPAGFIAAWGSVLPTLPFPMWRSLHSSALHWFGEGTWCPGSRGLLSLQPWTARGHHGGEH